VQVQAKKEERELTISGSRAAPAEAKPVEGEGSDAQQQAGRRRRIERRFGDFSRTFKVRHPACHRNRCSCHPQPCRSAQQTCTAWCSKVLVDLGSLRAQHCYQC